MTTDAAETAYFDALRAVFDEAPVTRHIPQRLDFPAKGTARIVLTNDARLHHGGGALHGGIIGLVLDNAGFFAAASTTDGSWVVTTEFKVNLLDALAEGDLVATGTVLRKGRHLVHAEMRAVSTAGTTVAVGLGTYAIVPRRFRGA